MLWIPIGFISLAIIFWSLGKRWEARHKVPPLKEKPKVSILIPSYKSEDVIGDTLQSVKELDYPKKEVIVVNDYPDRVPEIAKEFGYKVINSSKRRGKAISLNEAAKKASGEILFFLDADTIMEKDLFKKIVPWFSDRNVAAVAPKYIARNRKGLVPRLVSLENSYNSTMFKMHMFFNSMISFRGCGIAIRRESFENLGGWSKTLIEDSDFGAKAIHSGQVIRYELSAIVKTLEPTKFSEMRNQKFRWGRGAGFSMFNNRKAYANNFQSLFHFLPYVAINLSIILVLLIDFIFLFPNLPEFLNTLLYTLAVILVSATIHNSIIMWPEREQWTDIFYMPLYTVIYLPIVLVCYIGGIAIGINDRIKHKEELDFRHW